MKENRLTSVKETFAVQLKGAQAEAAIEKPDDLSIVLNTLLPQYLPKLLDAEDPLDASVL